MWLSKAGIKKNNLILYARFHPSSTNQLLSEGHIFRLFCFCSGQSTVSIYIYMYGFFLLTKSFFFCCCCCCCNCFSFVSTFHSLRWCAGAAGERKKRVRGRKKEEKRKSNPTSIHPKLFTRSFTSFDSPYATSLYGCETSPCARESKLLEYTKILFAVVLEFRALCFLFYC